MNVPFIDLSKQTDALLAQYASAAKRVLGSNRFILGPENEAFEKEASGYLGTRHAIGLASGSDALLLALQAAGIGAGDEVITTPFSFFATASAIERSGAKIVFADIDPETFNLDAGDAELKMNAKTKAILPVHLYGQSADLDRLTALARSKKVIVIEDAAQSFGCRYKGRMTGTLGEAGCYSFYPTKNLGGVGDGGLLVTSNDRIAERVRSLRNHGQSKRYVHESIGMNSRLDDLQAAILRIKLKKLDGWNRARQKHAAVYDEAFSDLPVRRPVKREGCEHIYHLYTLRTPRRAALASHLERSGIGSAVHYPIPLHLQSCFSGRGWKKGDLPQAEKASDEVISLPMFPELTQVQLKAVISAVRDFFHA